MSDKQSSTTTTTTTTATITKSPQPEVVGPYEQRGGSVSCLGETVYFEKLPIGNNECPSIENIQKWKYQTYVSDKDTEILDLEQFRIKQSLGGFKPNVHYWFTIRNNGEIRFIAPYAADVVDFFSEHYFIDLIGHSSTSPLDEFIRSYDEHDQNNAFIKYVGTFNTDENGKIKAWSNDSGHFGPSKDYAAAVAKAMGINQQAVFIPYKKYEDVDLMTYQEYEKYTGMYSAHNVVPYKDINYLTENDGKIWYPFDNDYHEWYKLHGHEGHPDAVHYGRIGFNTTTIVIAIVFVAVLIGALATVATTVFGMKATRKGAKSVVSDMSDDECDETDNT